MHRCWINGCQVMIEHPRHAVCAEHYRILPRPITEAISRGYADGMTMETASHGFRRAIVEAHGWLHSTFAGQDRHPHDPGAWERLVRTIRAKDEARRAFRAAAPADATPPTFITRRPDGWPLCPRCGEDELYSLTTPPREGTIIGCHSCNWKPTAPKFRHLTIVP